MTKIRCLTVLLLLGCGACASGPQEAMTPQEQTARMQAAAAIMQARGNPAPMAAPYMMPLQPMPQPTLRTANCMQNGIYTNCTVY